MAAASNGEHGEILAAVGLVRDLVVETRAEGTVRHVDVQARLQRLDDNQQLANVAHHAVATKMAVIENTCANRGKRLSNIENKAITADMLGSRTITWGTARIVGAVAAWICATGIAIWAALGR